MDASSILFNIVSDRENIRSDCLSCQVRSQKKVDATGERFARFGGVR
ncbi:hypothetical protein [Calothrix sp. PCC 6303]|nr:hypothetical protein [Calothrix sp. PCC 6303]